MNNNQPTEKPFIPRPKLKLSEIEEIIRKQRIIVPCPSRPTLIEMCEDGTFETVGKEKTRFGWLVFESSFWDWVKGLEGIEKK